MRCIGYLNWGKTYAGQCSEQPAIFLRILLSLLYIQWRRNHWRSNIKLLWFGARQANRFLALWDFGDSEHQARNQGGGGAFGHLTPPKFSKHCIAIFSFVETFKEQRWKFIFQSFLRNHWNFSLSCSLIIISLEDISWHRLSDRKLRNWLVFNHKYAGSVNLGYSLNCSYFKAFFVYLFVYYFVLDKP